MDQIKNHPLYQRHNLDTAMSSLWDFYKKNFIVLFLISLGMSLLMQYGATFINIKELQSMTDPILLLEKLKGYMVPILIISVINLLFNVIFQYYIIHKPIDSEKNFLTCLIESLKYFIPYLIIMILLAFAGSVLLVLGILALVVGVFFAMLYILVIYVFILPVLMIEEGSIGHTINRTMFFTHKNFWTNIGWVAVFILLLLVVSIILSAVILLPFSGSFLKTLTNPEDASKIADMATSPAYIILSAIASAITMPLMPILSLIMYFSQRAGEEQNQFIPSGEKEEQKVRVEDLYAKPYSDDHPDNPEKKD